MNEERPIRLLHTHWDRGLLAMVGWSLVLHVAAAGGILAVLPWAGARDSRRIPAYTVELTSLNPRGGGAAVGGLPEKEPKGGPVNPSPEGPKKTRVESKEAAPVSTPAEPLPERTNPPSTDTKKAAITKKPETAKKSEEAPKKTPVASKAESEKSEELAKKTVKPAETVAVKKPEPKKEEPKIAAKAKDSKKEESAPGKEASKPKPPVKSDAAKVTEKVSTSAKPSTASTSTAQKKGARTETKAEGATGAVGKDTERRDPGGKANLDDDSRYAAAIESVRRRVEQGGNAGAGGAGGQGAATGTGGGVGGGDQVVGTEFLIYYNIMISHIRQAWVWVGHDESLSVTVRFAIEPDGEIRNLKIDQSSGDLSYDQSVLHAVRKVNPLPPPPAAYRRDFSQVELTFRPGDLRREG